MLLCVIEFPTPRLSKASRATRTPACEMRLPRLWPLSNAHISLLDSPNKIIGNKNWYVLAAVGTRS